MRLQWPCRASDRLDLPKPAPTRRLTLALLSSRSGSSSGPRSSTARRLCFLGDERGREADSLGRRRWRSRRRRLLHAGRARRGADTCRCVRAFSLVSMVPARLIRSTLARRLDHDLGAHPPRRRRRGASPLLLTRSSRSLTLRASSRRTQRARRTSRFLSQGCCADLANASLATASRPYSGRISSLDDSQSDYPRPSRPQTSRQSSSHLRRRPSTLAARRRQMELCVHAPSLFFGSVCS